MGWLAHEDFRGTSRFAIERRLGAGAFGIVYRAYDRERQSSVALKVLPKVEPEAIYRFKREFRSLADIVHPNLVTLYELVFDERMWFFTMELVEGVTFLDYVRGAVVPADSESISDESTIATLTETATADSLEPKRSPADESLLRTALQQLVEGMSSLHEAGKLHRDIKPSNVMVSREGRVVVLDFGLATDLAPQTTNRSATLRFAGTPAYMSPELWQGIPATESSDWYSVGVMLYESLTGARPPRGAPATSPSQIASEVPEDLSRLCEALLQPDPEARPNGAQILARLAVARPDTRTEPVETGVATGSLFVGRKRQLEALWSAYRSMKDGTPKTVFIHGLSGIGKSALVERFLDELRVTEDATILEGRCYERESVPYKALDGLVDGLSRYLRHLPQAQCEGLIPRDVLALARLFPVLQRVDSIRNAERRVLEIPSVQELRRRGFEALTELLARLSDRRPVVLYIDDLQWGDIDSTQMFTGLFRPPNPPALLLVVCYRSDEAQASPLLRTLLSAEPAPALLEVGELESEDAEALARDLLRDTGRDPVTRARIIANESGGSPFFVRELVQHAGEEREVTLKGALEARLSRLSDETRSLLEIVALAGQPIALEIAQQAAGVKSDFDQLLAVLRTGHLVRTRDGEHSVVVEAYHDRIRETVAANLDVERRAAHHLSLACVLESSDGADAEMLAIHFRGGEEVEKAADYAVVAADRAAHALAFDRAAELYRMALELRPTLEMLLTKLGDALANAGRASEAAEIYMKAKCVASGLEALDLERRASEQLLRAGRIDEGKEVVTKVLRDLGMRLPQSGLELLVWAFYWRARGGFAGTEFREGRVVSDAAEARLRLDTCFTAGLGLNLVQPLYSIGFLGREWVLALESGDLYHFSLAVNGQACAIGWQGGRRNDRRALEMSDKGLRLAERSGEPHALGQAWAWRGFIDVFNGRFGSALEFSDRGEKIWREECAKMTWELANARGAGLMSLFFVGKLKEIAHRLPAYVEFSERLGDGFGAVVLQTIAGHVPKLLADDPESALAVQQNAIERWTPSGFHLPHLCHLIGMTEIDLYAGRGDEAGRRMREIWPELKKSMMLLSHFFRARMADLRARSALAAMSGADAREHKSLTRTVTRETKKLERGKVPWSIALAALVRASFAATNGRKQEAHTRLALVESDFENLDMKLHAAVARRRRGKLLGGDEGDSLVRAADAFMASQNIDNPDRMADLVAPGSWLA